MFRLLHPYRHKTDEELMALVQDKQEEAFDELWRRYSPAMQNFFFRRTGGNADIAADLTQDLFLQLWNASHQYYYPNKLRPYLFTIAFNLVRNLYRDIDYLTTYETEVLSLTEEAQEDCAFEKMDDRILFEAIHKALQQVSEAERLLFDLRFTDELSIKEIAAVIHIPEGTVKSRLHTLIQKLRKNLHDYVKI